MHFGSDCLKRHKIATSDYTDTGAELNSQRWKLKRNKQRPSDIESQKNSPETSSESEEGKLEDPDKSNHHEDHKHYGKWICPRTFSTSHCLFIKTIFVSSSLPLLWNYFSSFQEYFSAFPSLIFLSNVGSLDPPFLFLR